MNKWTHIKEENFFYSKIFCVGPPIHNILKHEILLLRQFYLGLYMVKPTIRDVETSKQKQACDI